MSTGFVKFAVGDWGIWGGCQGNLLQISVALSTPNKHARGRSFFQVRLSILYSSKPLDLKPELWWEKLARVREPRQHESLAESIPYPFAMLRDVGPDSSANIKSNLQP